MVRIPRVLPSAPEVGEAERAALLAAFDGGWIAPAGPDLEAFETDLARATGRRHAVGLASGTAALQLGLVALGVGSGDEVLVPTLTFVATANAVVHAGARPVLVDCDATWTVDVDLVEQELERRVRAGSRQIAAVVPVVGLLVPDVCADPLGLMDDLSSASVAARPRRANALRRITL